MKPLFTEEELYDTKTTDKLPCQCYVCGNTFYKEKRAIIKVLNNVSRHKGKFCSRKCQSKYRTTKQNVICKNCGINFQKFPNQIKKYKNNFCSHTCSATYNNKHKKFGTKRSKLEVHLEEQLSTLYPDLIIHYNQKNAINSELDIYIPSLRLAFELNGIFHYEPIFGEDKLNQIQNNDQRKFQACIENKIELCIIDSSQMTYFKPIKAERYLNIISNIIKKNC